MFEHLLPDPDAAEPRAAAQGPTDCGDDPIRALKTMFVDVVMGRRLAAGQAPALRPVFLKTHGIAFGTFVLRKDLPEELRVGIFGHKAFPRPYASRATQSPAAPTSRRPSGSRSNSSAFRAANSSWRAPPLATSSSRTTTCFS